MEAAANGHRTMEPMSKEDESGWRAAALYHDFVLPRVYELPRPLVLQQEICDRSPTARAYSDCHWCRERSMPKESPVTPAGTRHRGLHFARFWMTDIALRLRAPLTAIKGGKLPSSAQGRDAEQMEDVVDFHSERLVKHLIACPFVSSDQKSLRSWDQCLLHLVYKLVDVLGPCSGSSIVSARCRNVA